MAIYTIAFAAVSIAGLTAFVLTAIGFIQGIRENRGNPEEPSFGESPSDDADEVFYDVWGTKQMYSKFDADGNKQYYDAFDRRIGSSRKYDT